MKVLALVLLAFGLSAVSAQSQWSTESLDKAVDDVVSAFEEGMDSVPALEDPLALEASEVSTDSKSELAKKLRETLEETIAKIKENIDDKHQKASDLIQKAHDLVEQLKALRASVGDKAKELVASYKEKVSSLFQKIIDRIRGGNRDKREVSDDLVSEEVILNSLLLKPLLEQVKAKIQEHFTPEAITRYLNQLFGKYNPISQGLVKTLHERGVNGLLRVIDRILGQSQAPVRQTRAIAGVAKAVRDFFKNLGVNIREKYGDFAEWLNTVWSKGVDHAKDRVGRLREIAREVTDHAKEMHKETVREAVEALRPFKDELGSMWRELLSAARDALNRKE